MLWYHQMKITDSQTHGLFKQNRKGGRTGQDRGRGIEGRLQRGFFFHSSAMQNIKRRIERHSQNANSGVKMYCLFIMPFCVCVCVYQYMLSLFRRLQNGDQNPTEWPLQLWSGKKTWLGLNFYANLDSHSQAWRNDISKWEK